GVDAPVQEAQDKPASRTSGQNGDGRPSTSRFLLAQTALPKVTTRLRLPSDGVLLITDDGRGFAQPVAALLRQHGARTLVVSCTAGAADGQVSAGADDGDRLAVSATEGGAEAAVSYARSRYGHVRGIVH